MPTDEFDVLLERCQTRLSEISLRVPELENGGSAPSPVFTLEPPPVRRAPPPAPRPAPPPAPAAAAPLPAAPPSPPAASRPLPSVEPLPLDPEDDDVFPPSRVTPPPRVRAPAPVPARPMIVPSKTPAPASGRPSRRAVAVAGAAALAVAAGGLVAWLSRRGGTEGAIEIDSADALAVRADKGDLVLAEGKALVGMSRDGKVLERRPLDAPVESIDWEQGSLWSVDGRAAAVTERAEGGRSTVYPLNHVPASIFIKDKYLWTAEKGTHTIRQFLISRSILGAILQPLDSFDVPGLQPETIAIDDAGILWLVDSGSRRLYRLRAEGGVFKPIASAPLSPFIGPAGRMRGLSIEDDAVWVLSRPTDGARAAVRRILLSRLDWTPA